MRRFDVPSAVLSSMCKRIRTVFLIGAFGIAGVASATTTINHQFAPATISQGDVSSYTITIANDATVALTDANVTVILPADIDIASPLVSANGCGFTGVSVVPGSSSVVLTGGTVPASVLGVDGQCSFQVNVTSIVPGNHIANIPANSVPDAEHQRLSGVTGWHPGFQWHASKRNPGGDCAVAADR
jgi:uncharacterized repeat protein (TIGR01451 family)